VHLVCQLSIYNSFPVIRTASAKNRRFHVRQPTFLFLMETPLRLSRNVLHGWKDNSMLVNPLAACTPIYLQQFPSYSNRKCKKSSFLRTPAFILCFPWGRPWCNHAKCCMDGKRIRCLQIVSQHVPIYLPSYSNRKFKKSPFSRTAAHIFRFPWRRRCDYHAICCMDGKTIQCLPNHSQYVLSIFNIFRVIRCLSQCISPKIAIFTTFLFSLGTPMGQSR